MIHPFNENILAMENETPQTEREWRIWFGSKVDRLSEVVEGLSTAVKSFKENELTEIRKELAELKTWKTEIMSSWKTLVFICILVGGVLGILAKAFF
jgi:hypothetical protein